MKAVILAGGKGTRLSEETATRPKPMVEVGHKPILWHVMKGFAHHGIKEFVVAAGYRGEMIVDYFRNFHLYSSDVTFDMRSGEITRHNHRGEDWRVTVAYTGLETQTGGRLRRVRHLLDGSRFMVTYGDGVGNVDISRLLEFHDRHGRKATVTAVRPPSRFGNLDLRGDHVLQFQEKPQFGAEWISGGFIVFEPDVLDYVDGDQTILEREVLDRLAREEQLMAFRHDGFWQPMDSLREKTLLDSLWNAGQAAWKVWND